VFDALRGFAMLWMAIFHFDFDLNHFGWIVPRQWFFTDPFWVTQRTCILSLFLVTAGLSMAVAEWRGQRAFGFLRRWAQVVLGAALVSLATWWMFPKAWVWFGVLHAMAWMLLLTRGLLALRPSSTWLVVLSLLAVALPRVIQSPALDAVAWSWMGLGTHKPLTQDWVPWFPWWAPMLWGVVLGRWLLDRRPDWLAAPVRPSGQPLVTLGQWSLSFYLIHQPIFFGLLQLAQRLKT
jgi:uncharacterized membrane protein